VPYRSTRHRKADQTLRITCNGGRSVPSGCRTFAASIFHAWRAMLYFWLLWTICSCSIFTLRRTYLLYLSRCVMHLEVFWSFYIWLWLLLHPYLARDVIFLSFMDKFVCLCIFESFPNVKKTHYNTSCSFIYCKRHSVMSKSCH